MMRKSGWRSHAVRYDPAFASGGPELLDSGGPQLPGGYAGSAVPVW